jgi:glycerol-3-phosphate dehydrogenase
MGDSRSETIGRLRSERFDVLIIGGGINGAGIARDLMLRDASLRVGLVEKNHFASGTSGKNSQLIHGGLRYLKYADFHLVYEALHERATLLKIAGGLVEPLQFMIPCYSAKDRWFYGAGLALYDMLAGSRAIGHHEALNRSATLQREPSLANEGLTAGLLFYDCKVSSARLVLENIIDAEQRGAAIANYVEAHVTPDGVTARDTLTGETFTINARRIVDATGAWSSGAPLRLVRGSHLIFPRILNSPAAIAYFDEQGRIVFLIPWGENGDLTLVGTTDADHDGSPDRVHISDTERDYLISIVHRLYPNFREDPIASYSSLRPLIAKTGRSATSTSREHKIWQTQDHVLHISGGKYTTYRAMSEELVDILIPDLFPGRHVPSRTAEVPLNVPALPADTDSRIKRAVEREHARHLSDLLYVSTYWGYENKVTEDWLRPLADQMATLLNWTPSEAETQIASVLDAL